MAPPSLSPRSTTILERFPRHLEAEQPGKVFGQVVDALSHELDIKTTQLGRVRRARRLADADEEADLLLLAGLHGFLSQDFEILRERIATVRALLGAAAGPDVSALAGLLGLAPDVFPSWTGEDPMRGLARARLVGALTALGSTSNQLELLRTEIGSVIRLHHFGNATVEVLLAAAAAHLQLDVEAVVHSDDRFWHLARGRDRMRLVQPEPPDAKGRPSAPTTLVPQADFLALEENPARRRQAEPLPQGHGQQRVVVIAGVEDTAVTVSVTGMGTRTLAPMVVNVETGFGVAFNDPVPDGVELRFESDGHNTRLTLAGAAATSQGMTFHGAVFAGEIKHAHDFVFADAIPGRRPSGRDGTFAMTNPVDAFDPSAKFPHKSDPLPGAMMARGETRFAFFVHVGAYGGSDAAGKDVLAIPRFEAGIFDGSVYAYPPLSSDSPTTFAGNVGFEWQEREPFALRLWIPARFRTTLDGPGRLPVADRLRLLLNRHRAAGVSLEVKYVDATFAPPTGLAPAAVGAPTRPAPQLLPAG